MIKLQEYQEGEVVLPEGELGTGFCILESGTLKSFAIIAYSADQYEGSNLW